jgi:hypothetical protein
MHEFFAHPITRGVLVGVLTALALDLDMFLAFRKEHPGSSYDWLVVGVRCLKAAIVSGLAAAGVSAAV